MDILFRKKKNYYLFCIILVTLMCLRGDLLLVDGRLYSVLDVMRGLAGEVSHTVSIISAFDSGVTWWMYILIPVVSIPFASYIAEERASRFYLYVKERQGTPGYLASRLLYAVVNSAVILLTALGSYTVMVWCYFGRNPGSGRTEISELCLHLAVKFVYVLVYSIAISIFVAFCIYLYNDLYVDLSLALVLNYICRNLFFKDNIGYPLIMIVLVCVLYAVVRILRSEKM